MTADAWDGMGRLDMPGKAAKSLVEGPPARILSRPYGVVVSTLVFGARCPRFKSGRGFFFSPNARTDVKEPLSLPSGRGGGSPFVGGPSRCVPRPSSETLFWRPVDN